MKKVMWSKISIYVFAILAVLAPMINYACRIGYVFVDDVLFDGFSKIFLWLLIVNALFMLMIAFKKFKQKRLDTKLYVIIYIINIVITILATLLNTVYTIVSPRDVPVYLMFLVRELPYLLILGLSFFMLFILPNYKKNAKKIISIILIVAIAFSLSITVFHLKPFKFSSNPVVFDMGDDYLVTWATSDNATGYIKYTYAEKDYTIYDNSGGKINADRIHRVSVPYAHLRGNNYSVHSTRVLDERAYGSDLGKTLHSNTFSFRGQPIDNPNIICASDWHCSADKMLKAASYLDKPDLVLFLGDYTDAMYTINDIIDQFLYAGATLTESACPVIVARGNHDTRGEYASNLMAYLKLDKFYYDVTIGEIHFIIMDSNEDKKDSHAEYGGLAAFHDYRVEEVEWLEAYTKEPSKYTFALCHDPELFLEDDLSSRIDTEFQRLGVNAIISGHTHAVGFLQEDGKIPRIFSGGIRENIVKAAQFKINGNTIHYKSADHNGKIFDDDDYVLLA